MSMPDDTDPDALIARLARPLLPADRAAFRRAAEAALAGIGCSGPGAAYRVVAALQRAYFDPPPDDRYAHAGPRPRRPSKLVEAGPIGTPDPREGARNRRRFKLIG
jgi:hypothetical protein